MGVGGGRESDGGGRGGVREGWQPALGPHAGMQEMESREEGLQGATGGKERGTGWARLAKEHSLRLWTCSVSAPSYTKPRGCRAGFTVIHILGIFVFQTYNSFDLF